MRGMDGLFDPDPLLAAVRRSVDGRDPAGPPVVCWRDLDDTDTQRELADLAEWVTWVVTRYSLDHRTVPPCWARHGALVEELSALRSLWELCFLADPAPADPATFHERFALAIARLRDWAARRDCKPTQHRGDQPPPWSAA